MSLRRPGMPQALRVCLIVGFLALFAGSIVYSLRTVSHVVDGKSLGEPEVAELSLTDQVKRESDGRLTNPWAVKEIAKPKPEPQPVAKQPIKPVPAGTVEAAKKPAPSAERVAATKPVVKKPVVKKPVPVKPKANKPVVKKPPVKKPVAKPAPPKPQEPAPSQPKACPT